MGTSPMKLRDHPLMKRKSGMKSWPPRWLNTSRESNERLEGEVGILQRVLKHESVGNGLFLWIHYDGSSYVGAMYFDDVAFCAEISRILQSQIGVSLQEIGDLDLSYTL